MSDHGLKTGTTVIQKPIGEDADANPFDLGPL